MTEELNSDKEKKHLLLEREENKPRGNEWICIQMHEDHIKPDEFSGFLVRRECFIYYLEVILILQHFTVISES